MELGEEWVSGKEIPGLNFALQDVRMKDRKRVKFYKGKLLLAKVITVEIMNNVCQ